MLLHDGEFEGKRIIGRKTLELMTTNHLPDNRITEMSESAFSETPYAGVGFGLGFSVMLNPAKSQSVSDIGEFGWGGAASTVFMNQSERRNVYNFLNPATSIFNISGKKELRSYLFSIYS